MEVELNPLGKGLSRDLPPEHLAKGYYSFALNAVNEQGDGALGILQNERSTKLSISLSPYLIVGHSVLSDDEVCLFLTNPDNGLSKIVIYYTSEDRIKTILDDSGSTSKLNFSRNSPIQAVPRVRSGCYTHVYFTDNLNPPRVINLDRPEYYLNGINIDLNKLLLINNEIPSHSIEVKVDNDSGFLLSGQYSFAIQYWSESEALTDFSEITKGVLIYQDRTDSSYSSINGSSAGETLAFTSTGNTTKSIILTISDLRSDIYDFYRVVAICKNNSSGTTSKILLSHKISTSENEFRFTGSNYEKEITLNEVLQKRSIVSQAKTITTVDNRLILGGIKEREYRWHYLQQYASKIASYCVTKRISLSKMSKESQKNPLVYMNDGVGYQPGEIYSFGIVYVLADGSKSPVFHIPGMSVAKTKPGMYPMSTDNECEYSYQKMWMGSDIQDNNLYGSKVRHHRFPTRKDLGLALIEGDSQAVSSSSEEWALFIYDSQTLKEKPNDYIAPRIILLDENGNDIEDLTIPDWNRKEYFYSAFPSEYLRSTKVDVSSYPFDLGSATSLSLKVVRYVTNKRIVKQKNNQGQEIDVEISEQVEKVDVVTLTPSSSDADLFKPVGSVVDFGDFGMDNFSIKRSKSSATNKSLIVGEKTTTIIGIHFDNIVLPDPKFTEGVPVVGYYIVRNERRNEDKTIIRSGVLLPTTSEKNYISSGLVMPEYYTYGGEATRNNLNPKHYTFLSWDQKFDDKTLNFEEIIFDGEYGSLLTDYGCTFKNDVQDGTSKTGEDKTSDDDGWSLAIFSRVNYMSYKGKERAGIKMSDIEEVSYLNALDSTDIGSSLLFNTSCDNKSVLISLKSPIDLYNEVDKTIPYCYLKSGRKDSYVGYNNRPYFLESHKMIPIGESVSLFSGDNYVGTVNYQSHLFYENKVMFRTRKGSSFLNYFVAGLALVAGAALAIFVPPAGAALLTAGIALAGAATAAMFIASGVSKDAATRAYNEHYHKGLRNTLQDSWVKYFSDTKGYKNTAREGLSRAHFNSVVWEHLSPSDIGAAGEDGFEDDTIYWYVDNLSGVYMDCQNNIDLRESISVNGLFSFIESSPKFIPCNNDRFHFIVTHSSNGPDGDYVRADDREPRSLFEKASFAKLLDFNESKQKHSYRGIAYGDYYGINKDYTRSDIYPFYAIHDGYKYDSKCIGCYPYRVMWSSVSRHEDNHDGWRIFKPNDYKDVDLESDGVENVVNIADELYIHTNKGFYKQPTNYRERIDDESSVYIGTGDFASMPERTISPLSSWTIGISHWSHACLSDLGYLFLANDGSLYSYDGRLTNLSQDGMIGFFDDIDPVGGVSLVSKGKSEAGVTYDHIQHRAIVSFRDYKGIKGFRNINGYNYSIPMLAYYDNTGYYIKPKSIESSITLRKEGYLDFLEATLIGRAVNRDEFNIAFTLSYSALSKSWLSFYSYQPDGFISTLKCFIGHKDGKIYKHHEGEDYQVYYGLYSPFILDISHSRNPMDISIYDSVRMSTEGYKEGVSVDSTFNKGVFYNTTQSTGVKNIVLREEKGEWFMPERTVDSKDIQARKKERVYFINDIRDEIKGSVVYQESTNYLISDKTFTSVDNTSWIEKEVFRDKYICARLILDDQSKKWLNLRYIYDGIISDNSYR